MYITVLVIITSAYFFLLAFYLGSRKRLEAGRILAVVNVNAYLIIISYIEGQRAGEYLLYFPYFLVLTFLVSLRRNLWELIIIYAITVASAVFCLKYLPYVNQNFQVITE